MDPCSSSSSSLVPKKQGHSSSLENEIKEEFPEKCNSKRFKLSSGNSVCEDDVDLTKNILMEPLKLTNSPGLRHNPFLCPPVLSALFPYVDSESLKACQLVCTLWRVECKSEVKRKTRAKLQLSSKNYDKFMEIFPTPSKIPFDGLRILKDEVSSLTLMRKVLVQFGAYITSLAVTHFQAPAERDSSEENAIEVAQSEAEFGSLNLCKMIVQLCPNLKKLHLDIIPDDMWLNDDLFNERRRNVIKSPKINILRITDTRACVPILNNNLVGLMTMLPMLEAIQVDFGDDESLLSTMESLEDLHAQQLIVNNLKQLKFGNRFGSIFYRNHLDTLVKMNLTLLTELDIGYLGCDVHFCTDDFYNLFSNCRNSLQVLRMTTGKQTNLFRQLNLFLKFPVMSQLRFLEFYGQGLDIRHDNNFCTQFPKLEKFILDTESINGSFPTEKTEWTRLKLKWENCTTTSNMSWMDTRDFHELLFEYKKMPQGESYDMFERLRKWIPSLSYFSIEENHLNILDTINCMRALSTTNVEHVRLDVTCPLEEEIRDRLDAGHHLIPSKQFKTMFGVTKDEREDFPVLKMLEVYCYGSPYLDLHILQELGVLLTKKAKSPPEKSASNSNTKSRPVKYNLRK